MIFWTKKFIVTVLAGIRHGKKLNLDEFSEKEKSEFEKIPLHCKDYLKKITHYNTQSLFYTSGIT